MDNIFKLSLRSLSKVTCLNWETWTPELKFLSCLYLVLEKIMRSIISIMTSITQFKLWIKKIILIIYKRKNSVYHTRRVAVIHLHLPCFALFPLGLMKMFCHPVYPGQGATWDNNSKVKSANKTTIIHAIISLINSNMILNKKYYACFMYSQ